MDTENYERSAIAAVRDNPELLVKKFLDNYYSPMVVISWETARELREYLTAELEKEPEIAVRPIYIKAEQIGGPDQVQLYVLDIAAEKE